MIQDNLHTKIFLFTDFHLALNLNPFSTAINSSRVDDANSQKCSPPYCRLSFSPTFIQVMCIKDRLL